MIFGNPYEFAIGWDVPTTWSDLQPRFYEGLIFMYINGIVVPSENLASGCVERNLSILRDNVIRKMEQDHKFSLPANPIDAYKAIFKRTFCNDLWDCRIESESMEDSNINIFMHITNHKEYIYAGIDDKYVSHYSLRNGSVLDLINQAIHGFYTNFPQATHGNWWEKWYKAKKR